MITWVITTVVMLAHWIGAGWNALAGFAASPAGITAGAVNAAVAVAALVGADMRRGPR